MWRARSSGRAKPWNCCARRSASIRAAYDIDDRLMEISYGEWEGLTLPEIDVRVPGVLARRERDKWDFAPPGGECYREVARRDGEWYAALTRDTVVAAPRRRGARSDGALQHDAEGGSHARANRARRRLCLRRRQRWRATRERRCYSKTEIAAKTKAAEPWSSRLARSRKISRNQKLTAQSQYEARAVIIYFDFFLAFFSSSP